VGDGAGSAARARPAAASRVRATTDRVMDMDTALRW
jgi:hypothetical protein